ncbi:M64 family metallopeptidase [Mucilaginibacter ginsenosidivorans]|uniref:Peptidase M64 n=1 Tax=Mucilaginibacter ginsenosidivorans TaxID=398053 RepID=A0A5B8UV58_9SPHI|nr:M64 family metallopeptidase [Mucilaginibacter ginsenosidivorans]QEC62221.1 hypothetical protein FRZ54_06355 [Mucilaginibacter ginsenosidivorans]
MKRCLMLVCIAIMAVAVSCQKKSIKPKPDPKPLVYHTDGEVKKLYGNDPNGINMVIVGDAFIKDDLDTGGYYDQQVKMLVDYFFSVAPYKQNKEHFNVYVVYAESKKRGASQGFNADDTTRKLKSYFSTDVTRLLQVGDYATCYQYVQDAVPLYAANMMVVLVNDKAYGGSGGDVAVISTNELSKYIMIHEIGHSFGGLADEYADSQEAALTTASDAQFFPNTDTTNDPAKIKWMQYFPVHAYKGIVGAYQGGYYRATGVYRPELYSVMFDLGHPNYNAPSREAITRQIDAILNIPFDFNAFLNTDSASAKATTLGIGTIRPPMHDFIGMKNRVILMKKNKKQ